MIEVRNWGRGQIIPLTALIRRPVRLGSFAVHFKEDGAHGDLPSLAFECKDEALNVYVHEITLESLNAVLNKLGYLIVEKS